MAADGMLVGVVYNPPSEGVEGAVQFLDAEMSGLANKNVILVGDVNLNILQDTRESRHYKGVCMTNGFSILNAQVPTRVTRTSRSLIDHVLVSDRASSGSVIDLTIVEHSMGDHELQFLSVGSHTSQTVQKQAFYIKKEIDLQKVKQVLQALNEVYNEADTIDTNYERILQCFTKHITFKRLKNRFRGNTKPWFNVTIFNCIKTRDRYFKDIKKNPYNDYFKRMYAEAAKKVKKEIKIAKKSYYESRFGKIGDNSRRAWSVINSVLTNGDQGRGENLIALRDCDGAFIRDPVEICNYMNNFFVSIGDRLARAIPANPINLDNECQSSAIMDFRPATLEEIVGIVRKLDPMKAAGHDGIEIRWAKECDSVVARVLCKLVNQSLNVGKVPSDVKIARVVPLFKSGDKECVNNYRPVSILPVFSKVIERIVNNRLTSHLEDLHLLSPFQYGFRRSSDTSSAAVDLISELQLNVDRNKKCALVSLDLCKAFDTVNYDILFEKLYRIGIRHNCLAWFRDYLFDRGQFVQVSGARSHKQTIGCGVPQGSIVGPTLFLLYINSITNLNLHGNIKLYADDTTIVYIADSWETITHSIKRDMKLVATWLTSHKLTLNIEKSNYTCIGRKRSMPNVSEDIDLGNSALKQCQVVKFLGLHIDSTLSWSAHVDYIIKKIIGPVGVLRRLSYMVPKKYLRPIYFALVHSHLSYLNLIWYTASEKDISCLRILQKKAIKNLYGLPMRYPSLALFAEFKIQSLEKVYHYQVSLFIHSVLSASRHSNMIFVARSTIHGHDTRNNLNIVLPRALSNMCINSINYNGIIIYNNLPIALKELHGNSFKKKLKEHLAF